MTIIGHSKSFWTMLVGKDWEKCGMTKIGHSESFWTTLVGRDWKKCRTKIEHCLGICYKNVKTRVCQKLSFYILLNNIYVLDDCFLIGNKNVKTRVCQKLSLYILLALFMFWCPGCSGVLAAICMCW